MTGWSVVYTGYESKQEGLRESSRALSNGSVVSRAAATAVADDFHCPRTYLAGDCDRLVSEVAGYGIENDDLVDIPNWLPVDQVEDKEARQQIEELTQGFDSNAAYAVGTLARGIARIAAAHHPNPVIVKEQIARAEAGQAPVEQSA